MDPFSVLPPPPPYAAVFFLYLLYLLVCSNCFIVLYVFYLVRYVLSTFLHVCCVMETAGVLQVLKGFV